MLMSHGRATFRKADLSRAIKAVIEAMGVDVSRLRVRGDAASYEITVREAGGETTAGTQSGAEENPWDKVLSNGASGEKQHVNRIRGRDGVNRYYYRRPGRENVRLPDLTSPGFRCGLRRRRGGRGADRDRCKPIQGRQRRCHRRRISRICSVCRVE